MAVLSISIYGSTSVVSGVSSSDIKFSTLMVIFTVVHVFSSLLGIFCLHEDPQQTKQINNESAGDSDDKKETKPVTGTETDSENTALTPKADLFEMVPSYYGDKYGFEIMAIVDFWLLVFTFMMSIATDKTFFMNIGTYLRSFDIEEYLTFLTVSGPIIALVTKLTLGPISDACIHHISRIWFVIVPVFLKLVISVVFLFFGDHFVATLLTSYVCYVTLGAMFMVGPVLTAEYFGLRYYGRNFGCMLFAAGILTVILHVFLGLLYDDRLDSESADDDDATCKGLHCFAISTSVLILITLSTLCTSLLLWKRTPK